MDYATQRSAATARPKLDTDKKDKPTQPTTYPVNPVTHTFSQQNMMGIYGDAMDTSYSQVGGW